ncbi:MAG: glycoside hydrolase family 15 protein [Bryobacteraceae bacterium]
MDGSARTRAFRSCSPPAGATALAVACSAGFEAMSCGYVGASGGYTDIREHGRMAWRYTEADDGNVALTGGLGERTRSFVLAFGFGAHAAEAAQQARAGLQDFDSIRDEYLDAWQKNQRTYIDLNGPKRNGSDVYRVSTAVLQIHESKRFPGAAVAGLSIPWGFDRGDKDIGGYHVIWPRDMVQAAMGKLACGGAASARRAWFCLECTQEEQGNWTGIQMDATAYGILLADALRRAAELEGDAAWAAVEKAAGFLARKGPATEQERWEENAGYSPNTMAIEVAALLAAADFAERRMKPDMAAFLRATADAWNEAIDELTYAIGDGACAQIRRGGLLYPPQPAGNHRNRLARVHQAQAEKSAGRTGRKAGGGRDQPGCAITGAIRAARRGRSADDRHREAG